MKLVTAEQMRRIDRETIDNHGIPGAELMENAGRGIAKEILTIVGSNEEVAVDIFCGKGNNGGDGYVVGRHLLENSVKVRIFFLGPLEKLSADARLNHDRALKAGIELTEVTNIDELPETLAGDCLVDAIFGTGFSGAPRGSAGELIEYINRLAMPVFAVDMPSGLNADTGQHEGAVVKAAWSFPLVLPKYGLFVSPGRELAGEVRTVPIGVPNEVLAKFDLPVELITHDMVASLLPARNPDGHKGTFGKLFVLAGSLGMTGAAALTAKSAYRSGCGLVKIGCPRTVLPIIASLVTEATSWPLPDVAKKGALAVRCLGEVRSLTDDHDAVVIGPGIGQHRETKELIRRYVARLEKPAIIDADGLNSLAGHPDIIKESPAPLVLTPHPGEFKRLTEKSVPKEISEKIELAIATARELGCVLVLKGSPSLVANVDGTCYLNPTGNDGMASGGTGDVLSGMIGSFLAQGMSSIDAAVCAVYIHGLAGDFAAAEYTERSMIAGDMVDYLPEAFAALG